MLLEIYVLFPKVNVNYLYDTNDSHEKVLDGDKTIN